MAKFPVPRAGVGGQLAKMINTGGVSLRPPSDELGPEYGRGY